MNLATKFHVMVLLLIVIGDVCANVGARPLEEVSKELMDKKTASVPKTLLPFAPISLPTLPPAQLPGLPTPPKMSNGDTGGVDENADGRLPKDASAGSHGATARGYRSGGGRSDVSGSTDPWP
ncbi:hypothetical protein AtNW77_Chr1g0061721 [Arabidopsis thaliana]|uniref:Transmembrane protein n=2 Tax=Arabidopsis TaxID=3701 RepID=A0A178W9B0_ARATH|nr:hypothetical protein ISN45_At01g052380 [Arabidopsis thaliana x Arabidopsis arenosa]OAP14125.1 hypothetical protein AXX17_AT1G55330 [Arabidopsis thaliana]CAA0308835.1 unnamed protein product [Arabidopsis thaliana]